MNPERLTTSTKKRHPRPSVPPIFTEDLFFPIAPDLTHDHVGAMSLPAGDDKPPNQHEVGTLSESPSAAPQVKNGNDGETGPMSETGKRASLEIAGDVESDEPVHRSTDPASPIPSARPAAIDELLLSAQVNPRARKTSLLDEDDLFMRPRMRQAAPLKIGKVVGLFEEDGPIPAPAPPRARKKGLSVFEEDEPFTKPSTRTARAATAKKVLSVFDEYEPPVKPKRKATAPMHGIFDLLEEEPLPKAPRVMSGKVNSN
jgi:hypothetical protein